MKKLFWMLKQLAPCTYHSEYSTNGHREVAVWRQWLGRVLWHKNYVIA